LNNAFNISTKHWKSGHNLDIYATSTNKSLSEDCPIANLVASLLSSIYIGSSEQVSQSFVVVDSNTYLSEHLINFINDIVIDIKPTS